MQLNYTFTKIWGSQHASHILADANIISYKKWEFHFLLFTSYVYVCIDISFFKKYIEMYLIFSFKPLIFEISSTFFWLLPISESSEHRYENHIHSGSKAEWYIFSPNFKLTRYIFLATLTALTLHASTRGWALCTSSLPSGIVLLHHWLSQ